MSIAVASDLQNKYDIFTEYLGMEKLDLTNQQLIKIVPNLEKKMLKDEHYKKLLLDIKIDKLNKLFKTNDGKREVLICDVTRTYKPSKSKLACYGDWTNLVSLTSLYDEGWHIVGTPLSGNGNQQIILER